MFEKVLYIFSINHLFFKLSLQTGIRLVSQVLYHSVIKRHKVINDSEYFQLSKTKIQNLNVSYQPDNLEMLPYQQTVQIL
jgi:hypothetical protein